MRTNLFLVHNVRNFVNFCVCADRHCATHLIIHEFIQIYYSIVLMTNKDIIASLDRASNQFNFGWSHVQEALGFYTEIVDINARVERQSK